MSNQKKIELQHWYRRHISIIIIIIIIIIKDYR